MLSKPVQPLQPSGLVALQDGPAAGPAAGEAADGGQHAPQAQQEQQNLHAVDLERRSPVELEGDTFYDTLDSAHQSVLCRVSQKPQLSPPLGRTNWNACVHVLCCTTMSGAAEPACPL